MSKSSRSKASSRVAAQAGPTVPGLLDVVPDVVDITFKLRDCEFMEFKHPLDRSTSTVYDLMYSVAKQHGDTMSPEGVGIYVKENDDDFKPVADFARKLADFNGLDVFYYDFNPIAGSLLIIPSGDGQK